MKKCCYCHSEYKGKAKFHPECHEKKKANDRRYYWNHRGSYRLRTDANLPVFKPKRKKPLTRKQLALLRMIHEGVCLFEVPGVAYSSVKQMMARIRGKIDVRNNIQAALWYERNVYIKESNG